MAFDYEINDIAIKASEFVVQDKWESRNASDMILQQIECYYILSQCYTESLLRDGYETAFQDPIKIPTDDEDEAQLSEVPNDEEINKDVLWRKQQINKNYTLGLKLAESIQ